MSMLGSAIDTPLIWSKHVTMQIDKAEALASKKYAVEVDKRDAAASKVRIDAVVEVNVWHDCHILIPSTQQLFEEGRLRHAIRRVSHVVLPAQLPRLLLYVRWNTHHVAGVWCIGSNDTTNILSNPFFFHCLQSHIV